MPALDYHGSCAARSSRFGIVFVIRFDQYTAFMQSPADAFSFCMNACPVECRRRAGLLVFGIDRFSASDRLTVLSSPRIRIFVFFIGCRLHSTGCRHSSASSIYPAPSDSIGNPCEHRNHSLAVRCQKPPSGGERGMIGRSLHKAQMHRHATASSRPVTIPAPSIPPPALGLAAPRFGFASRGPIARFTRSARRPPLDCHQGGKIRELRREEEYFPYMPLRAADRDAKSLAQWGGIEGMFVKAAFRFNIQKTASTPRKNGTVTISRFYS